MKQFNHKRSGGNILDETSNLQEVASTGVLTGIVPPTADLANGLSSHDRDSLLAQGDNWFLHLPLEYRNDEVFNQLTRWLSHRGVFTDSTHDLGFYVHDWVSPRATTTQRKELAQRLKHELTLIQPFFEEKDVLNFARKTALDPFNAATMLLNHHGVRGGVTFRGTPLISLMWHVHTHGIVHRFYQMYILPVIAGWAGHDVKPPTPPTYHAKKQFQQSQNNFSEKLATSLSGTPIFEEYKKFLADKQKRTGKRNPKNRTSSGQANYEVDIFGLSSRPTDRIIPGVDMIIAGVIFRPPCQDFVPEGLTLRTVYLHRRVFCYSFLHRDHVVQGSRMVIGGASMIPHTSSDQWLYLITPSLHAFLIPVPPDDPFAPLLRRKHDPVRQVDLSEGKLADMLASFVTSYYDLDEEGTIIDASFRPLPYGGDITTRSLRTFHPKDYPSQSMRDAVKEEVQDERITNRRAGKEAD